MPNKSITNSKSPITIKISSTILIEVDLVENKFISKCFPESRAIVKYSEISFESAGYEVKDILDNDGNSILTNKNTLKAEYKKEFTGDNRIKVGIYNILNKVIDVALMYSDNIEHTLSVDFDLSTNVKYVGADKGGSVNMFDDFDIDYNKQKYLIETRCSGALIKPFAAVAVEFVQPTSELG